MDAISEPAVQKLVANGYKVKQLLEISQSTLSKKDISSEERISMQKLIDHLQSVHGLASSIQDLKECMAGAPDPKDPANIGNEASQLAMYALEQQLPEIQKKDLLIALQLIACNRYDQALEIAMRGLESPLPALRLKSSRLALQLIQHGKLNYAFQMIMKSLERFDFESIPMRGVEYFFKRRDRKTQDLLAVVESMQSRDDLPLDIKNSLHQFMDQIQNIQKNCTSNLLEEL